MGWRPEPEPWLVAERKSLRAGEEGCEGDTLPSLSLLVDEGGVGGNENPATIITFTEMNKLIY